VGVHAQPLSLESRSTITYKVEVYALAVWADTLPLFLPYHYIYSVEWSLPLCVLCVQRGQKENLAHPLEVSLYNINLIWHKNDDAATQKARKYRERKKLK
jgi:hypothetical protein